MKAVVIGLTLMSSCAFAKSPFLEKEIYVGGHYTCDFASTPEFLKAQGPFEAVVSQDGLKSASRTFKMASGDLYLSATDYRQADFHNVETNITTQKSLPVTNVSLYDRENNPNKLEFNFAFKTGESSYDYDRINCEGQAEMKKVPVLQLKCETLDEINDEVKPVKLRFALANLADSDLMEVLKYNGEADLSEPIKVTPIDSKFSSLNENLVAEIHRDYVLIKGDSDGFYYSHLRLHRPDLTQGIAWLESGDDEVPQTRHAVTCEIIGDVDHAFDDHRR